MVGKLSQSTIKLLSIGSFYLVLTVIWSLVSLQINTFESQRGYFEIDALLKFKILFPAAVFMGRFIFFNKYRLSPANYWVFPISLFLVGWSDFEKLVNAANIYYCLLLAADITLWAIFIKDTIETVRAVFRFWKLLPKVNYAMFNDIWTKVGNDLFKLGIWLTALLGLIFFYLVSFFMVDALLYSYLLLIPLILIGASLYLLILGKIKAWVSDDLAVIDGELSEQLNLEKAKVDPDLAQKTVWIQYLTLIRTYLKDLERPVWLLRTFILYLGCSGFILCLPYFFGRVIEL